MEKWQRSLYQPNLPLGADGTKVTASKAHITLSKEAAKEGMVLLKNNESLLPFQAGTRLALFGKGSFDYVKGGGGSGDVTVAYTTNLYEGFKKLPEKVEVYEALSDYYRKEVEKQYEAGAEPGMTVEPAFPEETAKKARAYTDTAVICISRFSGEGWDRKSSYDKEMDESVQTDPLLEKAEHIFPDGDFYLTKEESAMVEQVQQLFPKVAVVMNVGGMVDTDWFAENEKIQAVLMAWQGGMEGGSAAAELLCGVGSPSGKLSDTFAKKLEDYPSSETFHESVKYVDYKEDIYVGYRYFETIPGADKAVNYPFGYGLSYTTFERALVSAEEKQGVIRVRVNVTNTGKYPGKEVMQLYAQAPQGVLGKAKRVLAAFEKTRLLAQGETQLLTLEAPVAQLASYDDLGKIQKSAYVLEKGKYQFYLGTSVRETEQVFCFTMPEDTVTEQLTAKLVPTSLAERMLSDGSFEKLPQSEPNDPDYSAIKRVPREESDGFSPAVRALPGHQIWSQPYKKDAHIFMEVAEGKITLDEFVAQMTDEELAHILGGQPNTGVANTFGFGNMPEYGIPNIMTADGPAGLRIEKKCGVVTTAWPCATLLACTWNPDVVYQVGAAGAAEVKENNIAVWLTPAVNIHRSPLCGRNFEYYSEDPYLTGKMASAMVKGIQSKHIAATVKHFACNNKETNRKESDSRVSERAAREIYLKAFEIIVKEADPWCIMSSYNIVNGHRTSENRELLEDILRGEWNYQGMVTTDWWTSGEHYKEVKAGNDIKMACGFPESLLRAKEAGVLTREEMEICAKRILGLILKID